MKIKSKMLVFLLLPALLIFSITIGFIAYKSRNVQIENVQQIVLSKAKENSNMTQRYLENTLDSARTLSQVFMGYQNVPLDIRRSQYNKALENVLKANPNYLGAWTVWEPNSLDGKDQEFVNAPGHDNTGRYIPYWNRVGNTIKLEYCTDYVAGDFYHIPLSTGQEYITEPAKYNLQGKDVLMVSLCVPIKVDNKIVGVTGIDIALDTLQEYNSQIKLYETGFASLVSNTGTFVTHPDTELVEKNIIDIAHENKAEVEDAIKNGKIYTPTEISETGEKVMRAYVPIKIGNIPDPWCFITAVPQDETLTEVNALIRNIIITSILGLVILSLLIISMARNLEKPLQAAASYADLIASGDLTRDINENYLKRKDEIGQLAQAFNKMREMLHNTVENIATSAQELAASSEELSATTETASANMEEVSASTEEISASVEEVSASAQQINASSQEMNASATQLVSEMDQGKNQAQEIEAKALELHDNVASSLDSAVITYTNLEKQMKDGLNKAMVVEEISNMASLISDIAEQTNLLALNAAIEAARAGEQGRGFAVVAEEVRKLAEESSQTVTKIQNLTEQVQGAIQELTRSASDLLSFTDNSINKEYRSFLDTANNYKQDANLFYTLNSNAWSLGNQALQAINEVTNAIGEITITINQSAEGIQQIAQGTTHTSQTLVELNESSAKLSHMAEELNKVINNFKI